MAIWSTKNEAWSTNTAADQVWLISLFEPNNERFLEKHNSYKMELNAGSASIAKTIVTLVHLGLRSSMEKIISAPMASHGEISFTNCTALS